MTETYSEKGNPSAPITSGTKDLPITTRMLLPLSYGRLVGTKAIILGSWDKHPAYCWHLNVNVWHMRNGINVMVYFKRGE